MAVVAPVAADRSRTIDAAAISARLRITTVLAAARLLAAGLLALLRALLTRLSLLASFALLLSLLLSLLLTLLLTLWLALRLLLVSLTLLTFFTLLLPVAARSSFVQTSTQRVEIVGQLSSAIEIFFRRRAIRATRTLLRRLQPLRNVVEASFNRALVVTTSALLSLLTLLLTAVQRLLSFTNAIGDTVTRQRIRRIFQLARRALLALAAATHRARGLFKILLQAIDAVSQRVFPFA